MSLNAFFNVTQRSWTWNLRQSSTHPRFVSTQGAATSTAASSAPYDAYKFDVFNAGVINRPRMEDFKALVSKMTAEDPKLRPTALDCLRELSALISAL
ncbi:hypothetical protein DFJ73DRAFT_787952 [Zopfochytrium polystomum]|nr:hypothetical protein DFJ73DRAFT_787952 [Zopfochytrium polystomum]